MNKIIPVVTATVVVAAGILTYAASARHRISPEAAKFHQSADRLIEGLQQYKEFMKSYPSGSHLEIAKALSGRSEKDRVLILATSQNETNAKGEIIDPWGTPIQFYFSDNGVMIRSAGPNQVFEDSNYPGCDDLFRNEIKK